VRARARQRTVYSSQTSIKAAAFGLLNINMFMAAANSCRKDESRVVAYNSSLSQEILFDWFFFSD